MSSRPDTPSERPLLEVRNLQVSFKGRRRAPRIRAVRNVTFSVAPGETVGLVGESGSGKSTIARAITRLVDADGGEVLLEGKNLLTMSGSELRQSRRDVQMVFQDPYSSMNPAMVIGDIVGEPLEVQLGMKGAERNKRVGELLDQVGLSRRHVERYPYEFSGGQRQRIAIARAIATNPKLVILDEAVSALDVSTQNQIINLLEDLQAELGISLLFIAHDLAVVRHIANRTIVLYLGEVMEAGPTERIFTVPGHPYSEALLSAVPIPDPRRRRAEEHIVLRGDPPDPANPPAGCPFVQRCIYAMPDLCGPVKPAQTPIEGGGEVACHLQTAGPVLAGKPLSVMADHERHRVAAAG